MLNIAPDTYSSSSVIKSGLTMRDMAYVLFRRRWIILAISLPIIILGGISLFSQTGAYTASAEVVVELAKVDLPQWNVSGRNLDYDRELSTMFNIAMSIPVAERAAHILADSLSIIQSLDAEFFELSTEQSLVGYLMTGLDVSVVGESYILAFNFTSSHPRISLMAVGALRDAFVDYQVYGRKNPHAIAYYDEQLGTVRAEIDSMLAERGKVLANSGYSDFENEMKYDSGLMASLQEQIMKATANRRILELEHKTLQSYLGQDPRDFPMGKDESRSHTLVYWRNMVSKYEDQMNSILAVHTDDSKPAVRQRRLLHDSIERLRKEEEAYTESIAMAMGSAREREQVLRAQFEGLQNKSGRSLNVYQKVSLLDVEIRSLRKLLESLQGKRGEVRLSQMADSRVSSVVVLTEPELTVVLSGGKTVIYFIMIVFMAVALGVVVAFIMDSLDHRVYSPMDVEEELRLPVFGSVSRAD